MYLFENLLYEYNIHFSTPENKQDEMGIKYR